jgi:hypothetical protein
MIVRARGGGGQAAKPSPIFVLKEKPERKPLHQDMSGAGLQEEIDLGTFKVDPDHRSGSVPLLVTSSSRFFLVCNSKTL